MSSHEVDLPQLLAALSQDRLSPYLLATGGDPAAAIRLYEWNLSVSGGFYETLGILEVSLRNLLSRQLTKHHGDAPGHWYDDPFDLLSSAAQADISAARRRIRRMQRPETPGRITAELNFGFWKFLLAKRYEATLWTRHLRHAFPGLLPQRRSVVYEALDELHILRNRIAHHEPIHNRDLSSSVDILFRVLDWMDLDVYEWALRLSRIDALISTRPQSES